MIATVAKWTTDVLGGNGYPCAGFESEAVFTPDDVLAGATLDGPVVVSDFDHHSSGPIEPVAWERPQFFDSGV